MPKVVAVYTADCYDTASDGTKTFKDTGFATIMSDGTLVVTMKSEPSFKFTSKPGIFDRKIFDDHPDWKLIKENRPCNSLC